MPVSGFNPKKRVTIEDLASAAGVHKSTVSKTLAGKSHASAEVQGRIWALAKELGYEPDPIAQRLSSREYSKVVCLCSGGLDTGRVTEKISLLQNSLTDMGLEAPIYTPSQSKGHEAAQAALFRQVRRQRPQAIICSVYALHQPALAEIEAYQQEGRIVVAYDLPSPLNCDQVIFDREDNAYQGAKYLLERGHRDIGLLMSPTNPDLPPRLDTPQSLRFRGLRRALDEFGAAWNPQWLFESAPSEQGAMELAQKFLAMKHRPTGLCIVNDFVALVFMSEIVRAGVRVPVDVSLIGYDNHPLAAHCAVPLTSITQPTEEIVQSVVELLMARLGGDDSPPHTVTVRGHLIERESVAPPLGA